MADGMADGTDDENADTRLTLLDSGDKIDDDELIRRYAYPDRSGVWTRTNFISSIDGAATLDGRSGGMGGPGDRNLFALLRTVADIIVVGAGTARAEKYTGAHMNVVHRQQRRNRGQSEVPQIAIVTNSGRLARDMPVFTETEVPALVLTAAESVAKTRDALSGLLDADNVIDCSRSDPKRVDLAAALAALEARGHRRVLVEGGPTLLGTFVEQRLLDELCLTVAPCVVGGDAPRIAMHAEQTQTSMRCAHVFTDDLGYLYTRYVKV